MWEFLSFTFFPWFFQVHLLPEALAYILMHLMNIDLFWPKYYILFRICTKDLKSYCNYVNFHYLPWRTDKSKNSASEIDFLGLKTLIIFETTKNLFPQICLLDRIHRNWQKLIHLQYFLSAILLLWEMI